MRYRNYLAAGLAALVVTAASPAAALDILAVKVRAASLDPADGVWTQARAITIPLMPQNMIPPFGGGATKQVAVKALQTADDLYLLLRWDDASRNVKMGLSGKFLDGCAVQFPIKPGTPPSFMMGQKGGPVNIWLWKNVVAGSERLDKVYNDFYRSGSIDTRIPPPAAVQNLLAEGFGTLTVLPQQEIQAAGSWENGHWTVVLRRKLKTANGASLGADAVLPIAFAVWNGTGAERDGFKSLSVWHTLKLGRGKIAVADDK